MKRALAIVLAAGFVVGSYATDARVVVMGRHGAFYRDETSVFKNPADISLYPDMLYGSYGWMPERKGYINTMENIYPQDPFFGGMVSYRFSEEENGPMLSIGTFLNRRDDVLNKLLSMSPGDVKITKKEGGVNVDYWREFNLQEPVGKLDLIFGYDMGNGLALGLGMYGAYQKVIVSDRMTDQTSVYKGTFGANWNLEQGLDLEASLNGGMTTGICSDRGDRYTVSESEYFYRGDVRFFSAVPAINGSFVPQVSLEIMHLKNQNMLDLNGGVGVNMNIDRGFFWAGVQGVYTQLDVQSSGGTATTSIGGRFSFGIERNIMWDWFLIRVGGQKEARNVSIGNRTSTYWTENNPHDGTDGDLVSLGFGLNVDNRLRIDFVATEDLPYTFTNLVSGNKSHIFNRVSATYRF